MSDVQSFVQRLLASAPHAPKSVHLEFDVEGDVAALFEVLLLILTTILKTWYKPPIHIGRIKPQDMEKLAAYFASFGIEVQLDTEEIPMVLRIDNKAYERQSRLETMTFQMTDETNLYTIRFRYL
jgi:hypothetical protein